MSEQHTGKGQLLAPNAEAPVIAQRVNDLLKGRSTAVGVVTLVEDEVETVVNAPNCGPGNAVFLMPASATAATAWGAGEVYILPEDVLAGSFTIQHDSQADLDRSFFFICLG